MKLILPTELADAIQPSLLNDVSIVWADPDSNLDGDASDAQLSHSAVRENGGFRLGIKVNF